MKPLGPSAAPTPTIQLLPSPLLAGLYAITAEAAGFKTFESMRNKLDTSGALAVDATLVVGAATETVEVAASSQALQTESAANQALVTRQQIDLLARNEVPVRIRLRCWGRRPASAVSAAAPPGSAMRMRNFLKLA